MSSESELRRQLLRCWVDPGNKHGHRDVVGCICIVSQLQRASLSLIQVANKNDTIKHQDRKNEESPESQKFLPHNVLFLTVVFSSSRPHAKACRGRLKALFLRARRSRPDER